MKPIQIAIDGPSGAGKSTVARALAARLGMVYVDTGALYRTVGYAVRRKGIDPKDAAAVAALLPEVRLDLRYGADGRQEVFLNGEGMGDRIRTPEMSMYASAVSAIPAVRAFLLDTQREIAQKTAVIMDGRDIGTVILPRADVKIFLTASDECRAKRRWEELRQKGMETGYEEVLADMRQRDRQDREREIAPAVAAPDAVVFDNSWMDPDTCTNALLRLIEEKYGLGVAK